MISKMTTTFVQRCCCWLWLVGLSSLLVMSSQVVVAAKDTTAAPSSLSSSSSCTVQLPSSLSLSCAEFAASHAADVEWNYPELVCRYAGVDPKASSCFNVTLSSNNNNTNVRLTCRNRACHYATVDAFARVVCTNQACQFATIRRTTQHAVTCGRTTEPVVVETSPQQLPPDNSNNDNNDEEVPLRLERSSSSSTAARVETASATSATTAVIESNTTTITSNNNNNNNSDPEDACRAANLSDNRWLHCWGREACVEATITTTTMNSTTTTTTAAAAVAHVSCVGPAACRNATIHNPNTHTTTNSDTNSTTTTLTCRDGGACGQAVVQGIAGIECQSPAACSLANIGYAQTVRCQTDAACSPQTTIRDTIRVECYTTEACRGATFHRVEQAVCGVQQPNQQPDKNETVSSCLTNVLYYHDNDDEASFLVVLLSLSFSVTCFWAFICACCARLVLQQLHQRRF